MMSQQSVFDHIKTLASFNCVTKVEHNFCRFAMHLIECGSISAISPTAITRNDAMSSVSPTSTELLHDSHPH